MPKIIYIAQPMYFRGHYEDVLKFGAPALEAREIPFIANVSDPEILRGLKADVIYCFRGELVPPEIVASWKGLKIMLSTEPVPVLREKDRIEITPDRSQRMWELSNGQAKFDAMYHFDRTSIPYLTKYGFKVAGDFYLPVSKSVYYRMPGQEICWDVMFYGKETTHRSQMTGELKHALGERFCQIAHGFLGDELARLASKSLIGLNIHVDSMSTINPRVQQMMAMKLCVFSEPLSHGDLFKPGIHFVEVHNPQDLYGKVVYYLSHPDEMNKIAQAGYDLVMKHLDAMTVWGQFTDILLKGKTYHSPTSERKR
jgi:hypothetical protein